MGFTVPFASTRPHQTNNTIADLIQRAGSQQAEGIRRGGDISARMIGSLGDIASGAFQEYQRTKQQQEKAAADAPRLADEATMRGLTIKKTEQDLREGEAEQARTVALGQLFAGDSMPDPKAIISVMGPERGFQIVKGLSALQPDSEKRYRDQSLLLRDAVSGVGALPEALRPDGWKLARQNLLTRGLISEDMAAADYSPAEFARVSGFGREPEAPKAPESFSLFPGQVRFGPDGKPLAAVPAAPREPREAKTENKIWIMRPGDGGKLQTLFLPESAVQPGDQPANTRSGEGRPSLGGEKSTLAFFNRAKQADEELAKLTDDISKMGLGAQGWQALAPNFMQTQLGQSYQQAQRAFTEARLRKDSGAAIPETEFANDRKTYFVQPGDTKETIAQKERGRAAVLASLAFGSGRALNEFYGEDAPAMLEGYKARQGSAAAPPGTAAKGPKIGEKRTINGQLGVWDGKGWLPAR